MPHEIPTTKCSRSVAEFGGVRHVFAVAGPSTGDALPEQTASALASIKSHFRDECGIGSIGMQTVFLSRIEDQCECRRRIEAFYGSDLPATSYVIQPPCDGSLMAIEAWGIGDGRDRVAIGRNDRGLVTADHGGLVWAFLGDIRPESSNGPMYDRSLSAFRSADERLNSAGWRFDEVIRTWLYLGGITAIEAGTPRYRELNRARADFYADQTFGGRMLPAAWSKPVFPASTGIGTAGRDIAIGCLALRTERPDVTLLPLENPLQTAAYDYAHQYGPEKPKFVRAMAVVVGDSAAAFVSGTASITASESQYDDVARQTQQTLDNIEALIAADNFKGHGLPCRGATLADLAVVRVYVKRREDYEAVKAACEARLASVPILYVVGDICRPELLVEIEAIAFSGLGR
jgi:enamine deaminase RidA (YjgF/YER057c/UK114 family)